MVAVWQGPLLLKKRHLSCKLKLCVQLSCSLKAMDENAVL